MVHAMISCRAVNQDRCKQIIYCLQIEPFRNVSLFAVQGLFFRLVEIFLADLHSSFSQGKHTRFRANSLDVGTTELVPALDKLFQVDVLRQGHLVCVNVENVSLRLGVGQREFDLSIDTTGPNEGGIQALDSIRGHDDLDVAALIETVQLIQQLEHGSLDFPGSPAGRIVPLASDRINLIDKDNRRTQVVGHPEEFTDELGTVSEVLLDEFGSNDAQERGGGVVGHRLGEERLSRSRFSVQDHTLGGLDSDILVELGVRKRKLHRLLDFLDLVLEASNVGVALEWRLFHLHDAHHGIGVVLEYPDDTHRLVVQQNGAPGLEQVLVDAGENVDVVFGTHRRADNRVVVVDELLQGSDPQRRTAQLLQFFPLLLVALLVRLEDLVVANEFLLHEQVILDALQFQQTQLALGGGDDRGRFVQSGGSLSAAATSLATGGAWLESLFLFLLFGAVGVVLPVAICSGGRASVASTWYVTHGE
mmetsp:Transcript_11041/g.31994  ORF Transcript_11041/g.31994 Transcript_11041/m.31994 type:complete len:476 (+) Transcript_11041:3213-4640(+)